jgi:hypothetical protein
MNCRVACLRRRRGARPTTLAANSGASAAITVYNSRKQIRQDLYQAGCATHKSSAGNLLFGAL